MDVTQPPTLLSTHIVELSQESEIKADVSVVTVLPPVEVEDTGDLESAILVSDKDRSAAVTEELDTISRLYGNLVDQTTLTNNNAEAALLTKVEPIIEDPEEEIKTPQVEGSKSISVPSKRFESDEGSPRPGSANKQKASPAVSQSSRWKQRKSVKDVMVEKEEESKSRGDSSAADRLKQ